jgi:selenide,water dikinase
VPLLAGALAIAEGGAVPGGSKRNLAHAQAITAFDAGVPDALRLLLADAQTSGGLLLCVPAARADEAVERLHEAGCARSARIGWLRAMAGGSSRIQVRL